MDTIKEGDDGDGPLMQQHSGDSLPVSVDTEQHQPGPTTPTMTAVAYEGPIDQDNSTTDISSNQGLRLRCGKERSNTTDRITEDGFVMIEAENVIEAQKIEQNYMFGFKKWKSHLTARPLAQRSEVVRKLYEEPKTIQPFVSSLGVGNVLYAILFGWWISLIYVLVAFLMFLTIIGRDYGKYCLKLAWYVLWPFGKFVQKKSDEEMLGSEGTQQEVETHILENEDIPITITRGTADSSKSSYLKPSFIVWAALGLPILFLVHVVAIIASGFLVVFIPVSKMNVIMIKQVLLLPPKKLGIKSSSIWTRSHAKPREVIMCSYQAVNVYYYKYTIDGINIIIVNMLPIVLAALFFGYVGDYASAITKFILALISVIPMSYYIGMAITSISAQSTHAVGAVLNATFGSVIEITLYISTLLKHDDEAEICYVELVKSALTGSLLATMLLIPGISMLVGGIKHREQRFNMHSAGVGSSLLFISVAGAFTPTIFAKAFGAVECYDCENKTTNISNVFRCSQCHYTVSGTDDDTFLDNKLMPLVYICTTLLPLAYIIGLVYTLKTHTFIFNSQHGDGKGQSHSKPIVLWGRIKSGIILLVAVTIMSLCAELVADNIEPLLASSGMSELFIGVTILALATSIPEIFNGIQFALQNNVNLSIEIGSSVAVQVCLLQIPILVLVDAFIPYINFVLVFNDIHLWSVILSVVIMNYIFIDGKSDYFQGSVLVIVYLILIAMFLFAPQTIVCLNT